VSGPSGAAVSFDVLTPTITVEITRTPGAIVVSDTIHFTATTHADGTPLSYEWSFGDGVALSDAITASHIYTQSDAYTVIFTATDACGYEEANSVELWVGDGEYRIYLPLVLRR
jgi:PKD repeat protein